MQSRRIAYISLDVSLNNIYQNVVFDNFCPHTTDFQEVGVIRSLYFLFDTLAGGAAQLDWCLLHGNDSVHKLTHTVRTAIEVDETTTDEGVIIATLMLPFDISYWNSSLHLHAKLDAGTADCTVYCFWSNW